MNLRGKTKKGLLILTCVLLACLFWLPLGAQAALPVQHWTTAQGARVYFVESRQLPMLDLAVSFPAGSARDPARKEGLA